MQPIRGARSGPVILRKSRIEHIWSGLPLIASVYAAVAKSSVSAEATYAPRQTVPLFDHPLGAQQDRCRDLDLQCVSCFEIDYQLKFCRLLNGKVGWVFSA
jgi:hypothetical protein